MLTFDFELLVDRRQRMDRQTFVLLVQMYSGHNSRLAMRRLETSQRHLATLRSYCYESLVLYMHVYLMLRQYTYLCMGSYNTVHFIKFSLQENYPDTVIVKPLEAECVY